MQSHFTAIKSAFAVSLLLLIGRSVFALPARATTPGKWLDYEGDGKTDYALWRPSDGTWYIIPSSNPSSLIAQQLGQPGDIPVPGDYDGDGKTDYALWRPSDGTWYIIPSSSPGNLVTQQWGLPGDIPVPGDFDGDGKTDYALWRPSDGTWYIIPSSNPGSLIAQQLGQPGDIPVPGDFDGDGKTDYAVWRPSDATWYTIPSGNPGNLITQQLGQLGDIPVPDDFDDDGKTDYAVWRLSDGTWYIIPSSNPGNLVTQQLGQLGDIPLSTLAPAVISGQVTAGGAGLAGVTVVLSGTIALSTITDSTGDYSFLVPNGGAYTITFSKAGFTFTPSSFQVNSTNSQPIYASAQPTACTTAASTVHGPNNSSSATFWYLGGAPAVPGYATSTVLTIQAPASGCVNPSIQWSTDSPARLSIAPSPDGQTVTVTALAPAHSSRDMIFM